MKVNDYIKTKTGFLGKIVNINDFREPNMKYGINVNYIDMPDILFIGDKDIIKSSPNIIDLIQEGDYVNGSYVYETPEDKRKRQQILVDDSGQINGERYLPENEIKSIVTKEQFERCEYKI